MTFFIAATVFVQRVRTPIGAHFPILNSNSICLMTQCGGGVHNFVLLLKSSFFLLWSPCEVLEPYDNPSVVLNNGGSSWVWLYGCWIWLYCWLSLVIWRLNLVIGCNKNSGLPKFAPLCTHSAWNNISFSALWFIIFLCLNED